MISKAAELNIDPNRIILMGEGAGAHTALMAAFRATNPEKTESTIPIQAVVSLSALTSFKDFAESFEKLESNSSSYKECEELYNAMLAYLGAEPDPKYEEASPVEQMHPAIPYCFLFSPTGSKLFEEQNRLLSEKVDEYGDKMLNEVFVFTEERTPQKIFSKVLEMMELYLSGGED